MVSYQTSLFIGTLATIIFIIVCAKKFRMNMQHAVIWILWGLVMLVLSMFPSIIDKLSVILGISIPTNTVFLIFIFLLYLLSFYLFLKISNLSSEIKNLTYKIAVLSKELDEKDE